MVNQQIPKFQEKFWKDWNNRNVVNPSSRENAFRIMMGNLPVKSILEVGCNKGYNLEAISKIRNYELTGIDILPEAIKESSCSSSISLVVGDCLNIPFQDNSFDLVFTGGVLMTFEYGEKLFKAISELIRVSKRYILAIEYMATQENNPYWMVEVLLRFKGVPVYWARNYSGMFPKCRCIGEGLLSKDLGFDDISYWWLFEKETM